MTNEVVRRDELVELINKFLQPFREETEGAPDRIPSAAVEYLALKTGRKPDTVHRALTRILKENTSGFVDLTTADWLVAVGMGRPDLLYIGLEVVTQGGSRGDSEQLPQRKERPPVPAGVPAKKCLGPFCQGQPRPLLTEFYFRKSGRDVGRPYSYCKECERFQSVRYLQRIRRDDPERYKQMLQKKMLYDRKQKNWQYGGLVPYLKVGFAVEKLCQHLGTSEAARRLRVARSTIWYWRNEKVLDIHKEFAARILRLLWEVRKENGPHRT